MAPAQPTTYRSVPMVVGRSRAADITYLVAYVLETLLGLRFLLRLLGASTLAGFTQLVYTLSYPFVRLFAGIFNLSFDNIISQRLEAATLFAMLIYALVAALIIALIKISNGRHIT